MDSTSCVHPSHVERHTRARVEVREKATRASWTSHGVRPAPEGTRGWRSMANCKLLSSLSRLSSLHSVFSVDPFGLRALKRYFL